MRKEKPRCKREFRSNGQLKYEEYWRNGKLHNEHGPAYRWWYGNGQLATEYSRRNGEFHNVAGPAARWWLATGKLESEHYYLNDRQLIYQALLHGVICEGLPAGSE